MNNRLCFSINFAGVVMNFFFLIYSNNIVLVIIFALSCSCCLACVTLSLVSCSWSVLVIIFTLSCSYLCYTLPGILFVICSCYHLYTILFVLSCLRYTLRVILFVIWSCYPSLLSQSLSPFSPYPTHANLFILPSFNALRSLSVPRR